MSQLVLLNRARAHETTTAMDAKWDESKHPRKKGKFTKKGTGTVGKASNSNESTGKPSGKTAKNLAYSLMTKADRGLIEKLLKAGPGKGKSDKELDKLRNVYAKALIDRRKERIYRGGKRHLSEISKIVREGGYCPALGKGRGLKTGKPRTRTRT